MTEDEFRENHVLDQEEAEEEEGAEAIGDDSPRETGEQRRPKRVMTAAERREKKKLLILEQMETDYDGFLEWCDDDLVLVGMMTQEEADKNAGKSRDNFLHR